MIKIGIIGHKEVPSYNGGIEAVLTEMLPLINKEEFQVTVYNRWTSFYKPSEWFKKENYGGCKVIRIPTFKKSFLNAFVYSVLASIHAMFSSYDIVHYHAEGPSAMSGLPRLTGKKIVATNHGLDWARGKWGGFASKYLKFGEKMSVKNSDKLIVLSDSISKYFKKEYNKETIKIANGTNVQEFKEIDMIKDRFGLEANGYYFAIGRLVPEKGFHYLINAYKKLNTDIKLVVSGKLEGTGYCEELQEMAKDCSNIIFTNFVDGELKQELFSNCYAYIIPSDLEGMSISLLEALSYGCKVIASDIEDNKGINDKQITFFKHGSVESLHEVMKTITPLTEDERKIQIEFVKENFNWKKKVREVESVYRKAIGDLREEEKK